MIHTELENLCTAHNIGFITLTLDDPIESIINIPAKEKNELDWNMMNRLVDENKDFAKYIEEIVDSHKIEKFKHEHWYK